MRRAESKESPGPLRMSVVTVVVVNRRVERAGARKVAASQWQQEQSQSMMDCRDCTGGSSFGPGPRLA